MYKRQAVYSVLIAFDTDDVWNERAALTRGTERGVARAAARSDEKQAVRNGAASMGGMAW